MEKLVELLQQIADLANVGIEALQGASAEAPAEGAPPPEAGGEGGPPPEQGQPRDREGPVPGIRRHRPFRLRGQP